MSHVKATNRVLLAALASATAVLFAAAPAAGANPDHAQARGSALFGKAWVAKAIVKDGKRTQLVNGTRLVLRLRHHGEEDLAHWDAGCNRFFARLEVKPKRLRIGGPVRTMIGCERKLLRQDNRIARFLASDPRWKRKAGKLILRSGDDAIRLKRRR